MTDIVSRRLLAAAGVAVAGGLALAPTLHAESADEAAVNAAIDNLTKAMVAADKAGMEALVSDHLSYGHSSGVVQDKKDFVEVIASKKTVYKTITLSDATVAVDGSIAVARHTFTAEVMADGKELKPKLGVLQVWQKEGGSWKLLARQSFTKA
jgi:ketosteroid isomerase-like protein